ncbi:MAG: hypothetical protein AB8D78_15110, partial [Akkermansiaceae bacterium]
MPDKIYALSLLLGFVPLEGGMAVKNTRKRFLAPWKGSELKPAIYHCMSRVVNRDFVFGDEEREAFRMFMRMYENFSGCRVLSY